MALNETWNIRSRATACHATGTPFADGETLFAAIFKNEGEDGYERHDYCAAAWATRTSDEGARPPYSSWQTTFEPAHDPHKKPEIVAKESAESLLRRLIEEDEAASENARYILALMLERKKLLRQVDAKDGEEMRLLFYEHVKTGDAFIVRDPLLKLGEIDAIQEEVAGWLGGDKEEEEASATAETNAAPAPDGVDEAGENAEADPAHQETGSSA